MCPDSRPISCLRLTAFIHFWMSRSSMSKAEWPVVNLNCWFEMRLLEKRYDFMSTAMMDSMILLMIWSKRGLRGSAFVPFYTMQCWWLISRWPRANDRVKRAETGCAIVQELRPLHLFLSAKVWFGVLGEITTGESKHDFLISGNPGDQGKKCTFLCDHCQHFSKKIMG